jgi:site-specific DNA-adenine methylase
MFYYYGRKKQIAKHYPEPNYDCIVEPFAGSAAYSFFGDNWKKQILLIEKDEKVSAIWEWLINEATPNLIKNMPDLKPGEKSSEFLHIIHAATKMAFKYKTIKVTPVLARNWEISKRVMAENLWKIKHWEIACGDYTAAPNVEATWFIDPPYMSDPGMGYNYSSAEMDYLYLAEWCMERRGEIICCEGEYGKYLPFVTLLELKGVAGKSSKEKVFYKSPHGRRQLQLIV